MTDLSDPHAETRDAWNENAAFWDDYMGEGNHFVETLIWPATRRLLRLQPGEWVLDAACGNGLYARKLAALGARVTAFDFAPNMIARARDRTVAHRDRIDYRVVDATDEQALLALGAGRFDAAVCQMALMDMAEIAPLFRGLARLLKPAGRLVFAVMHPAFNSPFTSLMAEVVERDGRVGELFSVKVWGYLGSTPQRGEAVRGQPRLQVYFHRPLHALLDTAFAAGFVLDGLEEPAFPADEPPRGRLGWGPEFGEIPPVLVARLRVAQAGSGAGEP